MPPVEIQCARHVIEHLQPAIGKHCGPVAILSDRAAVVCDEYDLGAAHPFAERGRAFATEPLVTDLGDLVDQIYVKVDPETYPNGRFARLNDPEDNPIQLWEPKKTP